MDEIPDGDLPAKQQFVQRVWPALGGCVGCHGSQSGIAFLAPSTAEGAYTTVFEFQPPVIDLGSPASSLLLTMGKHTGPALVPANAATILAWLTAEREARVMQTEGGVMAGPVNLTMNVGVTLDLGTTGAKISFVPSPIESGLYLSELQITAGPKKVHVTHPLFVSRPPKGAAPQVDSLDRFGELDITLDPGEVERLGGGAFLEFSPANPLAIHFKTVEAL